MRRALTSAPHCSAGGRPRRLFFSRVGRGAAWPGAAQRAFGRTRRGVAAMAEDDGGLHSHEDDHYKGVAGKYMTAFFYTGEYEEWQKGHIARLLHLTPSCRLVDIGGGTGRFAQLLREAGSLEQEALCVDPSAGMLEQAAKIPGIRTECAGGLEFSQKAGEVYDRALIKEVVHHLTDEELRQMFHGIFAQLRPGGVCVTCTRPHIVQYPFFDAALEVWKRQQPPMEHYVSIMEEAGFEVSCEVCDYPATLGAEWWLEMVENRFWSTFSHFSDEELAAGIAEIRKRHCPAGADTISFTEQMVFISASKPAAEL